MTQINRRWLKSKKCVFGRVPARAHPILVLVLVLRDLVFLVLVLLVLLLPDI